VRLVVGQEPETISGSSGGRPVLLWGNVHFRARSSRCQRRIVAGVTIKPDQRSLGIVLDKTAINIRSQRRIRGRGFARFKTAS
jgi:hypothetical protein